MSVETDELGPGWDKVQLPPKGSGHRNDNLSLFMKLTPREEPYHIRLACTPVRFRKHRWAFRMLRQWPISPATDSTEKDLDIAWNEGKFMPVTRFAAFVFDRDNENKIRIVEGGIEIFGPMYNHGKATKVNPASPTKGWDWIAIVSETNINGKKSYSYVVTLDTAKGATPFTEEEIKGLEHPKFQRDELETRYFIKSTPEEIKDLWDQLPESARMNTPKGDKDAPNAKVESKTTQARSSVSQPVTSNVSAKTATSVTSTVPTATNASDRQVHASVSDDSFLTDSEDVVNEPADDTDKDEEATARMF